MFDKRIICQHRCRSVSVVTTAHMEHATDSEEFCRKKHRNKEALMPSWKVKSDDAEREYRMVACNRERIRMRDMNIAYETLRKILPKANSQGKKMSKIESLRQAIEYINQLLTILKETDGTPIKEEPSQVYNVGSYFVVNDQQQFGDERF